jgi:serine/threonine protein kinase
MLHCPTCGRHYTSDVQICPVDQSPLQADATIAGNPSSVPLKAKPPDEPPLDRLLGHVLDGKYRLEERLGIGGMGTVYRARHVLIDRAVAVKVLNPRFVEDEAARVRFHREARAAGRLQHSNAVAVTDFGSSGGYVYIVMELLEGRTLREILAKDAPLETARAVSIMLQTSAAVAAAHEAGIIHRDLKPANIFITQNADVPAVVKVLDFGIAKLAADSLDEDEPKNLTQVGAMIGTPRYMSPEQCNGLELTPAADVYSLGVILYEMLTGMAPFSGSSPLAIAMKHATDLPQRPREIVFSIPEDLEKVVLRALEKRPEDRPANAAAFRDELLQTAERLGLEHAAVTSGPDLAALRLAGVESPSGRLIVDLSRLRESRASSPGTNELTMVGTAQAADSAQGGGAVQDDGAAKRGSFSRVDVPLGQKIYLTRRTLVVALVGVGVLLAALTFVAIRSNRATPPVNVNANATPATIPSPSPSPPPSPSPSPVASPKHQASPTPEIKKKPGKVGKLVDKVKKILKKPF